MPDAVPAGRYARSALTALGVWGQISGRIVPAENVRAALALVERGETELGVVYASDAAASDKVAILARFDPDLHDPIRYPASLVAGTTQMQAAGFLDFLASDAGQEIFVRHGFKALK